MKRVRKYMYVAIPFVTVALSWVYEVTGYRRYGPDDPGVEPGNVDWGTVVIRAVIATVAYFTFEVIRRRRRTAKAPPSSET